MDDPILSQFLATRDAACPRCGYNLRGATTQVCPECAQPLKLVIAGHNPMARAYWLGWCTSAGMLLLAGVSIWEALGILLSNTQVMGGMEFRRMYWVYFLANSIVFIGGVSWVLFIVLRRWPSSRPAIGNPLVAGCGIGLATVVGWIATFIMQRTLF